jgi:hypothetical protein
MIFNNNFFEELINIEFKIQKQLIQLSVHHVYSGFSYESNGFCLDK